MEKKKITSMYLNYILVIWREKEACYINGEYNSDEPIVPPPPDNTEEKLDPNFFLAGWSFTRQAIHPSNIP